MKEALISKKQFDLSFIHLFSYLWQTDIRIIHLVIKVAKFQKLLLIFVFFLNKGMEIIRGEALPTINVPFFERMTKIM